MTDMAQLWADQQAAAAGATAEFTPGNLATKFLEPPFSVLDTRGGRWQDRRRSWLSLGIQSELGRGLEAGKGNERSDYGVYQATTGDARAFSNDLMKGNEGAAAGISIFDPVLCELAYRWWAPEGGTILDPFAGGSVRGIVAAKLGHPYTGVDLSGPQLAANREQAALILAPSEPAPTWLHGDSKEVLAGLPEDQLYDMVFSCPPYYDLEVYSDHPADLSNMSWHDFLASYEAIIEQAARHLRPDRFAVFVVSEIRDPEGMYRGLVPRTIHAFALAGLRLYNDAVLVNSAGSLPLRVTKQMEASRKLGRTHQNILCFLKGKPPRGWSYDRAAPPSPQLGFDLAGDPPASQATAGPAAAAAPAVAPQGAEPEDDRQRPTVAAEAPAPPCSRLFCVLPAGHAMGHRLELPPTPAMRLAPAPDPVPLGDGRQADPATGEILLADGTPYDALAAPEGGSGLQPAPGAGGVPEVGRRTSADYVLPAPPAPWGAPALSEPPVPEALWLEVRNDEWDPDDPDRPCWGCGRLPIGRDRDGGPQYERHTHQEGTP